LYEIIAQSSIPAGKYKLMMKLIKQNWMQRILNLEHQMMMNST
jgi:hypothetical protein